MRILIVEDEPSLSHSMESYFNKDMYVCDTALTLEKALDCVATFDYDCIILDLMLPDGNGYNLLEYLSKEGKSDGVIIISAKTEVEEKIFSLKRGADDYLIKPFYLAELAARVYSIIRRKYFDKSNIYTYNELKINFLSKQVFCKNEEIELTRKEYELLLYLISNKGRLLSKNMLAEHLSGGLAEMLSNHNFIYAHIKNLKRKLAIANCKNYIKTIYATGYKWEDND